MSEQPTGDRSFSLMPPRNDGTTKAMSLLAGAIADLRQSERDLKSRIQELEQERDRLGELFDSMTQAAGDYQSRWEGAQATIATLERRLEAAEAKAALADELRVLHYETYFASTPQRIAAAEDWLARYEAITNPEE